MAGKYESSLSIKVESEKFINKVARATTLNLLRGLVLSTPVGNPDTWVYTHPTRGVIDYVGYFGHPEGYVGGTARSSWQVSEGRPKTGQVNNADRSGSVSVAVAKAVTNGARDIRYPDFFVRSNIPYMERLNDGWSQQAPAKFVEQVINRVVRT
jgi:hypothetical protein